MGCGSCSSGTANFTPIAVLERQTMSHSFGVLLLRQKCSTKVSAMSEIGRLPIIAPPRDKLKTIHGQYDPSGSSMVAGEIQSTRSYFRRSLDTTTLLFIVTIARYRCLLLLT